MMATPDTAMEGPAAGRAPSLSRLDVAVLAGGFGTRIRARLGDTPKILAPIGDRTFLDHLVDRLAGLGVRRVVLCLGHLAERVLDHLSRADTRGVTLVPVVEAEPLGTAGALRFARSELASDPVLVINGDTWVEADLPAFVASHARHGSGISVLCVRAPAVGAYGAVDVDAEGRIIRFAEKRPAAARPGIVNGGVYLFSQAALDRLAETSGASLERDVLERLAPADLYGVVDLDAAFVDIGTPAGLARAPSLIAGVRADG